MKDPYLLHVFSPDRHVSPFDINMAYEARYDAVVPYSGVSLEDTAALTQDTIFSRGPKGVSRTGIFIGGRDLAVALDMFDASMAAMVPPFVVSVFTDPSGAITTASAVVAMIEAQLARQGASMAGKKLRVFGGTGPVGICVGIMSSMRAAQVELVSHQGLGNAQKTADDYNRRMESSMVGADGSDAERVRSLVSDAQIVVNCAKAGVRVIDSEQLSGARDLTVAADVNAVPPTGIEGIGVNDVGVALGVGQSAVGIGALAIGDVKYKVHTKLLESMYESSEPLRLNIAEALKMALELVGLDSSED